MFRNKSLHLFLVISIGFLIYCDFALCDTLRLKENTEGNKVEILDEYEDSFVVKIPKTDIEWITKDKPTEVKLWQEKKILWEDQGDYITIFLPKDKIVVPEEGTETSSNKDVYFGGTKTAKLQNMLSQTGTEGVYQRSEFLSQGKGSITGSVINHGNPVKDCKVKITYLKGQTNLFNKLFSEGKNNNSPSEEELVFETTTNEKGVYRFHNVPLGDYDIYWLPPGTNAWIRKLSEKQDITVRPGQIVELKEVDISKFPR